MNEVIILELVPTSSNPATGEVVQLSAIKVSGYNIVGRFDFRINKSKITNPDLAALFSYDELDFTIANSSHQLMQAFKLWAQTCPLLIIDNAYTSAYLSHYKITNPASSVFTFLNTTYHDGIIEELIQKYNLAPSNYIVDLLFEALLYENNNTNPKI